MLATALRWFLVVEIALYATLAIYYFDASPGAAALGVLAGVLGLRAWFTALIYDWAWVYRSPSRRLKVFEAVRMVLGEYAAFLLIFVLISPCEQGWMGRDRLPPVSDRLPLLLVHGYGCSRGAWWWLRRRLEAAGWTVATINLEPVYSGIDDYVDALAQRVDSVLADTGAAQLVLVGHSMGGLAARAYFRRFGIARVACLVTLGTPHAGSELARIGMGQNARQMEAHSEWLQALAREAPLPETVVIYSPHDNYVMPQANLLLAGAHDCALDGLGHLAMLFSPRAANALLAVLENTGARRASWKLGRST